MRKTLEMVQTAKRAILEQLGRELEADSEATKQAVSDLVETISEVWMTGFSESCFVLTAPASTAHAVLIDSGIMREADELNGILNSSPDVMPDFEKAAEGCPNPTLKRVLILGLSVIQSRSEMKDEIDSTEIDDFDLLN